MNQSVAKKSTKSWIWVIVIALVVLSCCCLTAMGGLVYLRYQGQAKQDVFSGGSEEISGVPEAAINTAIPLKAEQPTPQIEATKPQSSSLPVETFLALTNSGIWQVNEPGREATQISFDPLDAPWDIKDGLSPDKKLFGYLSGFGGATMKPMLVVLDVENQTPLLQVELTGPIIKPGMEGTHGDPDFEAYGAMRSYGSLAWSPDGTRLAFVAARDGNSADIYLFDRSDKSVVRLTDEAGHAAVLHWSPDGQFLQYVSVNTFGTGAGANMESLLVYDFQTGQTKILETLDSNGEDFLAWVDNSRFLMNSFSRTCGGAYNLRIVNAITSEHQMIVEEGFTTAAYDPENQFGMFSVAYDYDNCGINEPLDIGLMIFGESVPVLGADGPIPGEIGHKKFEQVTAYGIGFIPQGNLFTVYGDEGLQFIYYKGKYGYNSLDILPEVKGFVPYPSPTGDYWAWASRGKPGLWVTENNSNPVELSPLFTGEPLWSQDGQSLYFFETNRLFSMSAPQFDTATLVVEISSEEILGLVK